MSCIEGIDSEVLMGDSTWLWIGFNVFVLAMLALDLGVFHRNVHVVSVRESLTWTVVWVVLALLFNAGIWHFSGSQKALEFFTGYVIEKSLSVDNVFVFAMLFSYFAVPPLQLAHTPYKVDTPVSLAVVVGIIAASMVASVLRPRRMGSFEGPSGPVSRQRASYGRRILSAGDGSRTAGVWVRQREQPPPTTKRGELAARGSGSGRTRIASETRTSAASAR